MYFVINRECYKLFNYWDCN